ncbi:MAG TPA: AmmeMemoRadiSam system protein A [Vicinamibacterales bacterium]|jgi:AmmeMemoRadiSam system protein A|nr:AmmeMemoRadiSam system protein A [Vicinamibacterales bacterium]
MLTQYQRQILLTVARKSVIHQVHGREFELIERCELPLASGVFVTLKSRGELRGCLGTLDCCAGLINEVARCAADAATQDSRFPPVTVTELAEVAIEISVLGPFEPIDPASDGAFLIGTHGLMIERGRRRGLLLPQVAVEWEWTAEQFLRQTCFKAGLSADAWRSGATVYRFHAEVFGD